jgi:hypothetical protein
MFGWIRKLEAMAAAVAFAEQGEWRMAGSILEESKLRTTQKRKERITPPRSRVRDQSYRV